MTALGLMLSVWSIVEFRISAFEYTYDHASSRVDDCNSRVEWSAYVKARYVGSLSDTEYRVGVCRDQLAAIKSCGSWESRGREPLGLAVMRRADEPIHSQVGIHT